MQATIAWRIRHHIERELLEEPVGTIDPLAEGALDSLEMEELVAFIERTFEVAFADEELTAENFGSIQTLAAFVQIKCNAVRQESGGNGHVVAHEPA